MSHAICVREISRGPYLSVIERDSICTTQSSDNIAYNFGIRNKCDFPEEDWGEETLSGYHGPGSSTSGLQRQNSRLQHQANGLQRQMSDIIPDRYKVLPSNINFDSSMRVREESSAKVYQGVRFMWNVSPTHSKG